MTTQHSHSSQSQQLIEVVLTWGRDVVEVRHLDHTHTSLTVGTRPQDDLFLPLSHAASIELLARAPQGWIVTPLDGGGPVLVADVAARPGGEELARYDVGPFTVTIRRVEKARRLTLVPVFDALWANVATVTMAAMVAVVLVATFTPEGTVDNPRDPTVNMQRFMTLAVKKPEPVKSAPQFQDEPSHSAIAQKKAGSKAPKHIRSRESDAKVVEGKLALLFGDDAKGVFGGGDHGALTAALGSITADQMASAGSYLGLKPGRPGGTGTTGTYDVGRIKVGDVTKGERKGDLGPRTEREISTFVMAEPEVPVNVDKELIRKVVRAHVDQARHCYEKSLQAHAGLGGKVSMKWTIGADGTVLHAQHVRSGSDRVSNGALDDVGACLAKAVRTWRFPTFAKAPAGGVVVQYPFVFKAG